MAAAGGGFIHPPDQRYHRLWPSGGDQEEHVTSHGGNYHVVFLESVVLWVC